MVLIAAVATSILLMSCTERETPSAENPSAEFETSQPCEKFTLKKLNALDDGTTLWLKRGYREGHVVAELLTLTIGAREIIIWGPTIFIGATPAILAEVKNDAHRSLVIGHHRNGGYGAVLFYAIDPSDQDLTVEELAVSFGGTDWEEIKIENGTISYGDVKIVTITKEGKIWSYKAHPDSSKKFDKRWQSDGHLSFTDPK